MQFDPTNNIVKLCAEGMSFEGQEKPGEAYKLFQRAWNEAANDFEKFTAAHYVARHQKNVNDKLKWDSIALDLALKMNDENIKSGYPSLYLNVAKCYEDLGDLEQASENYDLALSFANLLPDDGYGKLIRSGIANGLERMKKQV